MRVMRVSYSFDAVRFSRKVSGTCTKCGKRRTRSFSATQSLNPFNVTSDGFMKRRDQIHDENVRDVDKQIADFLAKGFVCASCDAA